MSQFLCLSNWTVKSGFLSWVLQRLYGTECLAQCLAQCKTLKSLSSVSSLLNLLLLFSIKLCEFYPACFWISLQKRRGLKVTPEGPLSIASTRGQPSLKGSLGERLPTHTSWGSSLGAVSSWNNFRVDWIFITSSFQTIMMSDKGIRKDVLGQDFEPIPWLGTSSFGREVSICQRM